MTNSKTNQQDYYFRSVRRHIIKSDAPILKLSTSYAKKWGRVILLA